MKILSLDLIAFGPFNGAVLDLNRGTEGLHIVYGPNEAGKSSALRAIRQFLYGIPERSKDDFVHPFSKMRIGGKLKSANGEVLEVIRRKGRSGTLRLADDHTIIDDAEIQRFLSGVDADLFAAMFGIGYEDLVAGGREIVQGGGEIGRLIFAAGSGTANLSAVVTALQSEADTLFRPSGQKQKINEAIARLKQRRTELKEIQLPGREWEQQDLALKEAMQAKGKVEINLAADQRRLNRLQRIREALPLIAARRETLTVLEPVAGVVLLPEEFAARHSEALTRLHIAQSGREQALASLAELKKAFDEMDDPSGVLSHADSIESVLLDLGSQRKASRDRIALESRRSAMRSEARQILSTLREGWALEDAEKLRIKKPESLRIQELGAEYERIVTRLDENREKIIQYEKEISAIENRLEALPKQRAVEDLRTALAEAEDNLPLEKQRTILHAQVTGLWQVCNQSKDRLGVSGSTLDDVVRLPIPSVETARIFEDKGDGLERRLISLSDEVGKTTSALSEISRRLEETRLTQEVPTEYDLAAVRKTRDGGWKLIRATLQGGEVGTTELQEFISCYSDVDSLPDAFEAGMRKSDETADRLRREADRVAEKARLLSDRNALQIQLSKLSSETAFVQNQKSALAADWSGIWQAVGITPRSPREMRQWLADFKILIEQAAETLKREAEMTTLVQTIDSYRGVLSGCLKALCEPLGPQESLSTLVRRARNLLEREDDTGRQLDHLTRERMRLRGELESSTSRLRKLEADHQTWQIQWEQAVRPLGLGADTRPAQASAVIEELKNFFDKLRDAEVLRQRIEGIDHDAHIFVRNVLSLARTIAPDLASRPAEEAAGELQRRLTKAREAHSRSLTLQKQINQEQIRIRKAEGAMHDIQGLFNAMCAEAGCKRSDELAETERRSSLRRRCETQLRQQEERLLQLSGGSMLEEFIREAAEVDPDGIGGEIERLKQNIQSLTTEKSELDQTIGSKRTELGRMDGGDKGALIAEDIQGIIGGLEQDVEQYARVKIASRVLAMAIERFREKSQGPILKRASELFKHITCGSFEGLRADHDHNGNPVLTGVRPGGKESVSVEGMSDGTADQLYLALRLAGLEHYLGANEPMPFIVDDILIKFDDNRAKAALQALAALSKKTQVIFFTHHKHLPDMAGKIIDPDLLMIHDLVH